jgi:hypothetical protein
MIQVLTTENDFWLKEPKPRPEKLSDDEINERYARGEGRIVIETNREKLPGFVAAMGQPNYMDLRPFYQRRPRWSRDRQSLLIESFIMNIPVPPVFLYERDYNSFEVMDGQQRITALRDYYSGQFELTGLERWPELNGRNYLNLPSKIKAGLDRRSITSIVLLRESTADENEAWSLRETVFDRLNRGGVALERQEIRNALYRGAFNELLLRLSRLKIFRDAWGIPAYIENEIENNPDILENKMFAKMEDTELVLRFFALRNAEHYRVGMQPFLDLYMRKAALLSKENIAAFQDVFTKTLTTAAGIFGDLLFRPFDVERGDWQPSAQKAFYDAVMVGVAENLGKADTLISKREAIIDRTKELFKGHEPGTFTGRGNSKADIQERIDLFSQMLAEVAA